MNRQQERSEETRGRLLKAAESCFSRNGYESASVETICQAAGVSKGAFYHHFTSKQQVFLELLNQWLESMDQRLSELRHSATDVPQALLAMAEIVPTVLQTADERLPIYLEFIDRAIHDPKVWQATIQPFQRYYQYFANLIQAGIDEGTLRPVDPQATARLIIALAMGLMMQGLLDPAGSDWGKVSQDGLKVLLEGLVNGENKP